MRRGENGIEGEFRWFTNEVTAGEWQPRGSEGRDRITWATEARELKEMAADENEMKEKDEREKRENVRVFGK